MEENFTHVLYKRKNNYVFKFEDYLFVKSPKGNFNTLNELYSGNENVLQLQDWNWTQCRAGDLITIRKGLTNWINMTYKIN